MEFTEEKAKEIVRFKNLEQGDIFRFVGGRQDMVCLGDRGDKKIYQSTTHGKSKKVGIAWWEDKYNSNCLIYAYG
jgi:hypothetical protein